MGKECTVAFMKEFLQLALENYRALFYLQIVQSAAGESENLRVTSVYREYDKDLLESSKINSRYKYICSSVARSVAIPARQPLPSSTSSSHVLISTKFAGM